MRRTTRMVGGKARLGGNTYSDTYAGTILVGVDAVPISAVSVHCFNVLVQASTLNDDLVLVGNARDGTHIELAAGAGVTVEIDYIEKITARAEAGTQRVNFWAMI